MKKIIILIIVTSFAYLQDSDSPSENSNLYNVEFNKTNYIAWSVKTLWNIGFGKQIDDYRKLNPDTDFMPYNPQQDELIIVTAYSDPDEIFEIWYGSEDSYTRVDSERVLWVVDKDIREGLLKRNEYFWVRADYIFTQDVDKNLDYMEKSSSWVTRSTRASVSLDKTIARFSLFLKGAQWSNIGMAFRFGQPEIGYNYKYSNSIRMGIATEYFELGVTTPGLPSFLNGVESDSDYIELMGANGAYGAIHIPYNRFQPTAMFTFSSINDNSDFSEEGVTDFDYISFSAAGSISFVMPKSIIPFKFATLILKPGYYLYTVSHKTADPSTGQILERFTDLSDGSSLEEANTVKSGASLQVDFSTNLNKNRVPLFEGNVRYLKDESIDATLKVNINADIGFYSTYSLTVGDNLYKPDNSLFLGATFRIK